MSFNSLEFVAFFPTVVLLYFLLPYRYRLFLLLVASYFFYMSWNAKYALILVAMTLLDFTAGLLMGRLKNRNARRACLSLSLTGNLVLLGTFKYFNFFSENVHALMAGLGHPIATPVVDLILPLGISFHTFQTMAYAIDVYRGTVEPERNLLRFAVYVVFFPQLIAGPIERAKHFLTQFRENHDFDYDLAVGGLRLMLWGFFKKIVIADRLAVYVNAVYGNVGDHGAASLVLATYFFAFQIFCDFSGYCDIAIGGAQVLGFRLMENFDRPYRSRSISKFWQRWHMSLTSWFKDYVYGPLGGSWSGRWWWYFNLFAVFALSGLWHGAKWTYVTWGAIHGCYLVVSAMTQAARERAVEALSLRRFKRVHRAFQTIVTFQLVCFAWIFFRASSLADAGIVLRKVASRDWQFSRLTGPFSTVEMALSVALIALLEMAHVRMKKEKIGVWLGRQPMWLRWSTYYAMLCVIMALGRFDETQFIYFQF